MFDKKILGEHVRALRRARNESQIVLANNLNVGKSAISMIESGQRSVSADILVALANHFDVSLDFLTGRNDNPNSHKL